MQLVTASDIKSLGTILGIWAHPDDETFCAGGLIAAAAKNGQQIICVTATRGEGGVQDESRWPAERLASIREAELHDAMAILGVKDHQFLGYTDGNCDKADEAEAVNKIAELIKQYQPDTIVTFGSDGLTGHPDHKAVSKWASLAKQAAGSPATIYQVAITRQRYEAMLPYDQKLNIFFNIDQPNLYEPSECQINLTLNDELFDTKKRAMAAQASQMEHLLEVFGDGLRAGLGSEEFVSER